MKMKGYVTVMIGVLVLMLTNLGLHAKAVSEPALCTSHSNDWDSVDATIVALLPLHRAGCDDVRLKPLQQLAAIQLTLAELNNAAGDEGLKIGLQVMDTCSTTKRAVRMAFKALVLSDPSICKKSPLFLGFLGPEDDDVLEEVKLVTGVFYLTHVTSLSVPGHNSDDSFHVATIKPLDKLKALQQLLKELKWTAVTIIHASDRESSSLASTLMASSRSPCVSDLRVMRTDACDGLLSGLPTVGIVVIAAPEWLANLLHCIRSTSESHTYLLVSSESGILPALALHNDLPNVILVMQEISPYINGLQEQLKKSTMWDEYLHQQRCNYSSCSNTEVDVSEYALIQDPSVTPMSQAVKLYARALRIVHKLKCGNKPGRCSPLNELTPEEWRGTLRSASERGIRFHMEQRSFHQLYYKSPFSYDLEKVGNITDGGRHISIKAGLQLAASHHAVCKDTARYTSPTTAAHTTVPPFTTTTHILTHPAIHERSDIVKKTEDDSFLWFGGPNFNILDINSYSMPEFIIAILIFFCVLSVLFTLLIYAVYSNFKVKGNDERSRDGSSRRSSIRSN